MIESRERRGVPTRVSTVVSLCVMLAAACQTQRNYTSNGPRFGNAPPPHLVDSTAVDTLRVVTFNIEFARQIDSALKVLRTDPELADAHIVLLQEMDNPSARYIARSLGMWYAYYPATRHIVHGRDFGNAVLSKFPIIADRKIVLPHVARWYKTLRTATAATIVVGRDTVRVYSAHLGTVANINPAQRRDQLEAILADAGGFSRVILGGDMNHPAIGQVARDAGYAWPTEYGPATATVGRLDHIFLKGLSIPHENAAGTVLDNRGASDHRPVWARAVLR